MRGIRYKRRVAYTSTVTISNVRCMDSGCRRSWVGLEGMRTSEYLFLYRSASVLKELCLFRTIYFFLKQSPLQFKVCGIFQLSIDCGALVLLACPSA